MKEDFLHLVWLHQYLAKDKIWQSTSGEVEVIKPGFRNRHLAGPDFEQAKIKIGQLEWAGSVEIHVRASEWVQHGHHLDKNYNSVVLHVVWENNAETIREDGTAVPTLEIQDLIHLQILVQYRRIMAQDHSPRPCKGFFADIMPLQMVVMQERVLVERLERKAQQMLHWLEGNQHDWVETFYQAIAWNLGLKSNNENMLALAKALPLKILASQNWKPDQLIPIFLGMSGIKKGASKWIDQEFGFFQHKFRLEKPILKWNKFKVREPAWPENRILQLAIIAPHISNWFRKISNLENPLDFEKEALQLELGQEWKEHLAENEIPFQHAKISRFLFQSLIINTFCPMLVAMGIHFDKRDWVETAIQWLSSLKPEKNHLISEWEEMGIMAESAAQSQALIELNNAYCQPKKCLNCNIGIAYINMGVSRKNNDQGMLSNIG